LYACRLGILARRVTWKVGWEALGRRFDKSYVMKLYDNLRAMDLLTSQTGLLPGLSAWSRQSSCRDILGKILRHSEESKRKQVNKLDKKPSHCHDVSSVAPLNVRKPGRLCNMKPQIKRQCR
jgi:hypothetical protein